jgi:hypothetical protein
MIAAKDGSPKNYVDAASISLVIGAGILAHWPALLSDSMMWDDWLELAWITQARLDWAFHFYDNYGVTLFVITELPFIFLIKDGATSIHVAKLLYLLGVILVALLITLLSVKVARGDWLFAALAGISTACFPPLSGEGFHISMLRYYFFLPLFFGGLICFVSVASTPRRTVLLRLVGLIALFLSFGLNSLLVLFYALVPAIFCASGERARGDFSGLLGELKVFVLRHLDFLTLPLAFWILKEVLTPRLGIYSRYNRIMLDWAGIAAAYKRLIPDVLQAVFLVPVSIQLGLLAALAAFVAVMFGSRGIAHRLVAARGSTVPYGILFALGLLALVGAALPYIVVGRRSFQAFGFMSRDNLLFPVGIAWMTAALFCAAFRIRAAGQVISAQALLLRQRAVLAAFASLIVLQVVCNWRNHADWQAHYAYYRSAIEKIRADQVVRRASVVHLVDLLPGDRSLQGWKYPTSIWTSILTAAFSETARLAIPFSPDNGRFYTREEVDRRVRETEVAFMLEGIDLNGEQARLTVAAGNGAGRPGLVAWKYWHARFLAPAGEMAQFLDSLTTTTSVPVRN